MTEDKCAECGSWEDIRDLVWLGCCGGYFCEDCQERHDEKYSKGGNES